MSASISSMEYSNYFSESFIKELDENEFCIERDIGEKIKIKEEKEEKEVKIKKDEEDEKEKKKIKIKTRIIKTLI
jgi:hypothetical protein